MGVVMFENRLSKPIFSVHAVEQFVARCAPTTSLPDALNLLRAAASRATFIRSKGGARFWAAPDIDAILVVRGSNKVTTVYRGDDVPEVEDVPNLPADGRAAWKAALTYVQERADAGDHRAAAITARLRDEGTIFAAYGIRG